MSDEMAERVASEQAALKSQVAQGGRSVCLTITMHPNGQIEFSMPTNKVIAHGLLGVAQEQLAKIAMMQELQELAKSANGGGIQGLLKKMGRG